MICSLDSSFVKFSTSTETFSASSLLVVIRMALASSSCSAWESRSAATYLGFAVSSASTRISLGPAMESMLTKPKHAFLARATKFQPLAFAGSEVYPILSKEDCVVWNENPLPNCTNSGSYIFDDIEKYICQLNIIDSAIKINAKQIFIPFIAKGGKNNKDLLSKMLKNIFGEDYKNLIVEQNLKDQTDGTIIEPTNISLFLEQLQNAKKKILDESFLYLGVGAPAGKLAHESEIEVQQNEKVVDLLDNVIFVKLVEFFNKINEKFGTKFEIIKEF